MKKRGQEGGAAALVALIALFMILYILFLPPEERSKLLGETKDGKIDEKALPKTELLLAQPGRVIPKGDVVSHHPLPSVILTTKTEAIMLDSWDSVHVRHSVFSSAPQELKFSLHDPDNVENVLLNFLVVNGKGILTIKLNGEQIFSREVTARNIEPISLKKSLLHKDNILAFTVSSPSPFWQTNTYILGDISVRGDIIDKTKTASTSTFYMDSDEKKMLKRATLSYVVLCDPTSLGKVTISLNNKVISDGAPACSVPTRLDVPIDFTSTGTNTLQWKSDKGTYKFEGVTVEGGLKEPQNYHVYFTVSPEQYDYGASHALPIMLTMIFVGGEKKQARLFVNNELVALDTTASEYATEITGLVRKGYNAIEIDPAASFEIQELHVEILKPMG